MSNFFQQGAQRTEQQAEDMNSYARGSQNAYRAIADKSRDDSGRYSLESAKSLLPAPSLMDPDGLLAYVKRAGSEINYG